ncbi:MAG: aspartate/glutamate racemase family protein [Firmicutes bacterium]|nr:aspartate/glutamate racemase family protein [Bacillota bacterium]
MPVVGLIHSTRLVIQTVHDVVAKAKPELEIINVLDEGLLKCLRREAFHRVVPRMTALAKGLEEDGAELIIVTCSSLSPYVDGVREHINAPIIKIDEPMIQWAIENHDSIGIVMTNPTTQSPTASLVEEVSRRLNKEVKVEYRLCGEAFERLNRGDVDGHDAVVVATVETLMQEVEVVLLAQISIARVIQQIDPKIKERVFSSLDFITQKLVQ